MCVSQDSTTQVLHDSLRPQFILPGIVVRFCYSIGRVERHSIIRTLQGFENFVSFGASFSQRQSGLLMSFGRI
jgi:hypothetical protein